MVVLPLTVMLPGGIGHLPYKGVMPYEMWKVTGKMTGEASAGVSEDDMALIQDYMMGASQLKAPTMEGGP